VQGNTIGTDASGTRPLGNGTGVDIEFGLDNTVGGTASGAGNLISGNQGDGVRIVDGSGNQVQGNFIGTDTSGTQPVGNGTYGVLLIGSNSTVGGTASGAGNLISGNRGDGVLIAGSGDQVQGNTIGTDVTGTLPLGNDSGVSIIDSDNTVGGTDPGARNLISGNRSYGVSIGGSGNQVQGNFIGTDTSGTQALGNGLNGVDISGSANTLGGTAAGAGNFISGNQNEGVRIEVGSNNNQVQGNTIGTDVSGIGFLPNAEGIYIGGSNNTIGGTTPASRNVIWGNTGDGISISGTAANGNQVQGNLIYYQGGYGVYVSQGTGNLISQNSIYFNMARGIYLVNGGNHLQMSPTLTSAVAYEDHTTISGLLGGGFPPNATFTLEFFSSQAFEAGSEQGDHFLGQLTVTTAFDGTVRFDFTSPSPVPAGWFITATATDSGNNTSEFSDGVQVQAPGSPSPGPRDVGWMPFPGQVADSPSVLAPSGATGTRRAETAYAEEDGAATTYRVAALLSLTPGKAGLDPAAVLPARPSGKAAPPEPSDHGLFLAMPEAEGFLAEPR
jgi:titin